MTQTVVLSLLLFAFNAGALAQPAAGAAFAAKDDNSSHDIAEIQGCLEHEQGNYILIDKNNEYQRLSENKNLKKLLGHEVRVTGTPQIRTIDNTPPGGASSAIEQRYFRVKTVEDVTPNCQAYGR